MISVFHNSSLRTTLFCGEAAQRKTTGLLCWLCLFAMAVVILSFSNFAFAGDATFVCKNKDKDVIKNYKIFKILAGYAAGESIDIFFCNDDKVTIDADSLPSDKYTKRYFADVKLSKDRQTIIWNVQNFCCGSYLTTEYLLAYQKRKNIPIYPDIGQVWGWEFSKSEQSIIVKSGFSHGIEEPSIDEYDIKTGKKIRHIKGGK